MTVDSPTTSSARQRTPRQEDTQPWHRQFWPWFLIALPGSVVIASFCTLYIANRYSDDLVVDSYYKDGMAINVELAKQRVAAENGITASLQILDRRVQIRLGGDIDLSSLKLQFSHPLEADRDFFVDLRKLAPGLYDGELPATVAPHWHWILGPDDESWRIDGSLAGVEFMDASLLNPDG